MTGQQYYNTYHDQSLLWAPSPTREPLRGQCVQAVCFYVAANGKPVIWADAVYWFTKKLFPEHYEYIDNSPSAVPQPGDIIVWGSNTPGSGGAGHIAVCLYPMPGTGQFVSVDQNWGGKTVHRVTHNYNNVIGWLRIRGQAPAPAAQPEGEEMIADTNQAHQAYQLLRPNGDGSPDEINGTAGRRSWASFARDAQPEINARNQAIRDQAQHMADMQTIINQQNQTITDLNTKLRDSETSNTDKQKAFNEAMVKIADQNSELATLHDKVAELQPVIKHPNGNVPAPAAKQTLLAKIFTAIAKRQAEKAAKK